MDIKSGAYKLYLQGVPQNTIAEVLDVTPQTIGNWSKKYNWEAKRMEANNFKETSAEKIRGLIQHNLNILERIAKKQAETLSEKSSIDELQKALIQKGESDALSKLYAQIKGAEADFDVVVKIVNEVLSYLENENLPLAQKAWPLAHEYLNIKRKEA